MEPGIKDLWKRWVLSLNWKVEAVIGDESEGGECDEVTSWYAHDEVNQEDSEQNEVDGMKNGARLSYYCYTACSALCCRTLQAMQCFVLFHDPQV